MTERERKMSAFHGSMLHLDYFIYTQLSMLHWYLLPELWKLDTVFDRLCGHFTVRLIDWRRDKKAIDFLIDVVDTLKLDS
jgi:hypothetical protein